MRLIDADALLAKYSDILDCEIDHPKYQDTVREIIENAPTVDCERWIPCSERLPSEDGRYLVCMSWEYDNMEVLKWADGWNCFRCPDGKVSRECEIDGADIIAWMPLPEPYREEAHP